MGQHIGIRVAQQALFKRHLHAAQDQLAVLDQTVNIITMTNAHIISFFLFGAGQIFPRCDLQIGVIPLGQLHRAAGQFKQAAVIGDQAGFFRIQLVQRGQIRRAVEALGGLHRIQGAAVRGISDHAMLRHSFAVAPHSPLDGILYRHGGGGSTAGSGCFQRRRDDSLTDKGTGGIMDSHQLSVGGQHAVLRALGAGRAALYHLHRLCAGRGLLFQKFPVLPGHQNDLADQRTLRKGPDAPLHHGLPAQIKAELVKPHAGGGPCRHQNG